MRFWPHGCAILLLLAALAPPALANDQQTLESLRNTTLRLIELLVQQGLLPQEKADELIRDANRAAQPGSSAVAPVLPDAAAKPGVVRVPYVPEHVRQEIKEEIRQEVITQAKAERWGDAGALPAWVTAMKWEGDLRLRFQQDNFDPNNAPALNFLETNRARSFVLSNTTEDRDRLRLRARLGFSVNMGDAFSGGVRIATGTIGTTGDPVSTNQTQGSFFNRSSIGLDLAYIQYDPYEWLSLSGGRIRNPWFSTDLVWDADLTFEGVAATLKPRIREGLTPFLTAGVFPLQEVELSSKDKWLWGTQVGLDWEVKSAFSTRLGVAYYEYRNMLGRANPPGSSINDFTAPQFMQKGNTLFNISSDFTRPLFALASDYRLLNVTASFDLASFDPIHATLTADYVRNLDFDRQAVSQRAGFDVEPKTKGYGVTLALGTRRLQARHDWQAFFTYKRLERDAVLDAFTDSDFHLGGTDAKGWVAGASYALGRNAWLSVRWLTSDSINGPPLATDTLQLDLNARF